MKKHNLLVYMLLCLCCWACGSTPEKKNENAAEKNEKKTAKRPASYAVPGVEISFKTADSLTVTADLYMTSNAKLPLVVLHHQAGYSRGAYRQIAPRLNQLGFNCLALDQRSGKAARGVSNKTAKAALKAKKGMEYVDAIPDLEAGLAYVKGVLNPSKIIYWGSSYSASLMFYMANKYPQDIDAVLAFSPGEYMEIDGKKIADYAKGVKCPVFITSAKKEADQWKGIYEALAAEAKYSFLPKSSEGMHGSKALWKGNKGMEEYWAAVEKFLTKDITKTAR